MTINKQLDETITYFSLLFDKEDFVWTADYIKTKHISKTQAEVIEALFMKAKPNGAFLAVNGSAEVNINKESSNVRNLRNFLIEFDKLPLDEQIPFFESLGIPYTACVFSGGKSYHFIISLDEPANNIMEYKDIFYRIHFLCKEKNDKACSDPARFTRFPNSVRGNTVQKIVKLNTRVSKKDLWARLNNPDFIEGYSKTKWFNSFVDVSEFARNMVTNTNRNDIIAKLDWYLNVYQNKNWTLGRKTFAMCPVCHNEGHDKHQDNLHVQGELALFHCFADPDHGEKILPAIYELMVEHGAIEDIKKIETVEPIGQIIDWSIHDV